ncbi:hypothetical protein RND81_06G097500 [Saponaria officinalis]|uniref:Uncharacterized protein n=1 Tax=Saponaria officinalis TaxID=3572 RepID=A0AAW1K4M3_SAPOF
MIVITIKDLEKWNSFVQEHPSAVPYRNKAIEYWDDICTLYGPDRALGDGVEMHDEAAMTMDEEIESEEGSTNMMVSSSRSKKQKRDRLAEAVTRFTECFSDYVQSKPKEILKPSPNDVHEVVKNVDGIERNQIMRATKRFLNGPINDFEMLKKLPEGDKLGWVLLCLNEQ